MFELIPIPSWPDVLDILFLGFVAYYLYEWFRETRALRVIIGLIALGGIYSVAKFWGLFLTTWAFQILWQVLLILLLILFQSEIRQVLEKVSPLRYLRLRRNHAKESWAHQLAGVLFDLAAAKTGALIVIRRDDPLTELVHAGHEIQALPDPSLIQSIFNRLSPAHDGALILAKDRLTHMGCILPLSEQTDLPEKYGTRHRAALGLAERCDAVCLVVSEERSEVSSVVGGRVTVWPEPRALAAKISDWTGSPDTRLPAWQNVLRALFVQNWKPKLVALALVTFAWMILATQQEVSIGFTAPILYANVADRLELAGGSARTVSLTLSGSRKSISSLREEDVKVLVDLNKKAAGDYTIKLSATNVDLPLGVKIKQVTPPSIRVALQEPRSVHPQE